MTTEITTSELKERLASLLVSQEENARLFKETDSRFKETDLKFKETDKKIKAAFDLFTNQWGRLMESLVEGDLIALLRKRGILVDHTTTRVKGSRNGEYYEFDIVAVNSTEVVVTEVKTTLRPDDVKKFKDSLAKAKTFMPEYTNYRLYGAMAYLQEHSHAAQMAESEGFFVVKATGSSASISNAADFKPKAW
ncbi:MAG: hypothetical protein ACKVUS_14350 [Saprospiraceae bacterium]